MIRPATKTPTACKSAGTKPVYRTPRLLEIGRTVGLAQGPMGGAYFDAYTYGKTYWPNS